jgi:hypothetical protein
MKATTSPIEVARATAGLGLFATEPFDEGAAVDKFEGRTMKYERIPEDQLPYAFELDRNKWIVPATALKYINHSCEPNCFINGDLEITAYRRIEKGEEITIMYNEVTLVDYMKAGSKLPAWDPRRTFKCVCGARNCIGVIDRYIVPVPDDPNCRKIRIGVADGRGRAVYAGRAIAKGEVIERAPVIVMPGKQWKDIQNTTLIDYAFDWGEDGKEAVIALGYISIYNHSYSPNAILEELFDELMIEIHALRDIEPGEEITVNYNGDPANEDALWFTEGPAARA